jgi:hypothetical protein
MVLMAQNPHTCIVLYMVFHADVDVDVDTITYNIYSHICKI